jgi:hypothetical protein
VLEFLRTTAASPTAANNVTSVSARGGFRIWVAFADGTEGEIDLTDLVEKGVFRALKEKGRLKGFVDPDAKTVAWPGGLDLAPDALYKDCD